MTDSMKSLVEDAIAVVRDECVAAHELMVATLGDRRISFRFGGEAFEVALTQSERADVVHVETTARVLRELIRGSRAALDAIISDDLHLRGAPSDLVAVGDAGLAFLKGAVRSDSADALLARLDELASRLGGTN